MSRRDVLDSCDVNYLAALFQYKNNKRRKIQLFIFTR